MTYRKLSDAEVKDLFGIDLQDVAAKLHEIDDLNGTLAINIFGEAIITHVEVPIYCHHNNGFIEPKED